MEKVVKNKAKEERRVQAMEGLLGLCFLLRVVESHRMTKQGRGKITLEAMWKMDLVSQLESYLVAALSTSCYLWSILLCRAIHIKYLDRLFTIKIM